MSSLPLYSLPGDRLTPKIRQLRRAAPPALFRTAMAAATRDWQGGGLTVHLPDSSTFSVERNGEGPDAEFSVRDFAFMKRVMAAGDIGFAEGYIAGEWDTPDLPALLEAFAENFDRLQRLAVGSPLMRASNRALNLFRRNTPRGSKRNIHAHYDLGNDFYKAWLDPSMSYSSAVYAHADQPLLAAQREKYDRLARAIELQSGHHVLEIGCGWGAFAEFAATEYNAQVTGLTISEAQYEYARARLAEAGLSDRTDIRLQDYRRASGTFDRVVSIEMFEAVGEAYWPNYFDQVRMSLRPGGKAGLQIITIRDDLFDRYRQRVDFIQKYVFPGDMLPSETRLKQEVERAGLIWRGLVRYGHDYARTLHSWAERFELAWPALQQQGFDEPFRRLWRFYLGYCEAGFRTGRTDVVQLVLERR